MSVDTAVILCAGLGKRMRPLTQDCPKPLVSVQGAPILGHILARLRRAGITRFVVNAHYLAEQVEAYMANVPGAVVVREDQLLDTGGSVVNLRARGLLPDSPFFIVNGDAYWVDGPTPSLPRMLKRFSPERQDALLLLARAAGTGSETGQGDFIWPRGEGLRRRAEREVAPYMYAGVQLVAPSFFDGAPDGPFSLNLLWDKAIAAGRLGAIVHDGVWFHLSTPEDIALAEAVVEAREVGNTT